MRVETSKIVFENCRPGAPVVNIFEEKAAKESQDKTASNA